MENGNRENKLRMLIVDDDDPLRTLLTEFFQEKGLNVKCCRDGDEAVDIIRKEKDGFHIVLTDLVIPKKGGLEVLRTAKQHNRETQVVIMTGFSSLEMAIDTMRQGAFDYITKPFKLAQIDLIINKIAERKRLIDENQKLSERIQSLYTRLDMLKDNHSKLDKFIAEASERLEHHSQKIDDCLKLIKNLSLQVESLKSTFRATP